MDDLLVLAIRIRLCTKLYVEILDLPHCRYIETRQLQGRLPAIRLLQDLIFSVSVLVREYTGEACDTTPGFQAILGLL